MTTGAKLYTVGAIVSHSPFGNGPTTASACVSAFLRQGVLLGIPADDPLRAAGIHPAVIGDPDARVSCPQMLRLLQYLESTSEHPSFGLLAAENLPKGEFGIVDFVIDNAPTLAEGLTRLSRYLRLLTDLCTLTYQESERAAIIRLDVAPGAEPLESLAVGFAFGCVGTRAPGKIPLKSVRLRGHPRANASHLESFFNTKIEYNCQENALLLDLDLVHHQLQGGNPHLSSILEKVGNETLSRLPTPASFAADVRVVLEKSLTKGAQSAHIEVARRLAVSPRTLQRRLQAEGSSFTKLLLDTQMRMACELLRKPHMALAEIAYVLGFSGTSAFHRAFKRWTGQTPLAFRAESSCVL